MAVTAVIYGVGAVSAAGIANSDLATCVNNSVSSISEIVAFEVPDESPGMGAILREFEISRSFPSIKSYIDRCTALALQAGLNALQPSAIADGRVSCVGLSFGSQFACIETMKMYCTVGVEKGWRLAPPFIFIHSYANTPAACMHIELKLHGYGNVFAGGEDCGFDAIADAVRAISSGEADNILAGASESLGSVRFNALFDSGAMGTLDAPIPSRFPGEGAAFLYLASQNASTFAANTANKLMPPAKISVISQHELDVTPQPQYVFIAPYDGESTLLADRFGAAKIEFSQLIGDCASANVPIAITAFLLSNRFPAGSCALFPSSSNSCKGYVTVEK